jgi:uncharacterized protein (TIGR02284 family)
MHATAENVETFNSLLRGEIAATETYQQAMDKLKGEPEIGELRRIHGEHREAADALRQHVHMQGGQHDQGSGAWGVWAKLVEGGAKLLGKMPALKALKEGEEHGRKSYEDVLNDEWLPVECTTLIRSRLIPQTREHISALDRLLNM